MPLKVELITPEKTLLSVEVSAVTLPGVMGQLGILPGHLPLLTTLMPGPLWIQREDRTDCYAISGGLAQVENDRVKILAETAESRHEIDLERAERARKQAEKDLAAQSEYDETFAETQASFARALNRVTIAKG